MALPADNEREPEGRIKWLEPVEEERLLGACAESDNSQLLSIVTIALETGMRYAHLAPDYIRSEVAKTERRPEPAAQITQEITHEPVELVGVSRKSL